MNAGGVDKACKSNGFRPMANWVVTGRNELESREYADENQCNTRCALRSKDLSLSNQPASYQLVGKVMAYQGYDA